MWIFIGIIISLAFMLWSHYKMFDMGHRAGELYVFEHAFVVVRGVVDEVMEVMDDSPPTPLTLVPIEDVPDEGTHESSHHGPTGGVQ